MSGEPYRKATPVEVRRYSAVFALTPIWILLVGILLFLKATDSYIQKTGTIGLGLWWFGGVGVVMLSFVVWMKFVPVAASWVASAIAWIVLLVLAFSGKIF